MICAPQIRLPDAPHRTNGGAKAAIGAFFRVDHGDVVHHMNSPVRAGIFALFAGNAGVFAFFACNGALFLIATEHHCLFYIGDQVDQMVRASGSAQATANANTRINPCHSVRQTNGSVRANLRAIAIAKASIGAGSIASEKQFGRRTWEHS